MTTTCRWLLALAAALAAAAVAPARAADAPGLAPGGADVSAAGGRVTVRARAVPLDALCDRVMLETGVPVRVAELDRRPVSVSFEGLTPRAAVARIGAALGDLVPVQATIPRRARAGSPAPLAPETEIFLVRDGTPRQRLIEAHSLSGSSAAQAELARLLLADGPALLPDLDAFLADTARDQRRRAMAVHLLGRVADPSVPRRLLALLAADPQALPREGAAVALGRIGGAGAAPALRRALGDADAGVALAAAWALVRLGDGAGVTLALARIGDARPDLALRAIDVIEETGSEAHLPALERNLAARLDLVRERTRSAMAGIRTARLAGPARTAALAAQLADPSREVRHHALRALAAAADPGARAAIDRAAADPAHPARREAAKAVARLQDPADGAGGVTIE